MIKQRITPYPARQIGKIVQGGSVSPYHLPGYSEGVWTTTYGNYGWPEPNHRLDVGGPFFQKRYFHTYGGTSVTSSFGTATYTGQMYATIPQYSMPSNIPDANTWGAETYDRMKPAKPKFDGLNALFELKDLPDLTRAKFTDDIMNAPSHYLAIQFGWLPLFRDIVNLVDVQRNGQKYMKQLMRDNGRPVRRGVVVKNTTTSSYVQQSGYNLFAPVLLGSMYAEEPKAVDTISTIDTVWASAKYRYWLPEGPRDINWKKNMLRKFYGGELRPSVVYNAIPWSWMTDWFTSFGSIVENLDNGMAERLTADYHYVMRKVTNQTQRESYCRMRQGSASVPVSARSVSGQVTKSRLNGTPFGWGKIDTDLSPLQLSIMGAIGLSRL